MPDDQVPLRTIYETTRDIEGDEMVFEVVRKNPKPGETVSAQALDDLGEAFKAWVRGRITHHWRRADGGYAAPGPSVIRVRAAVGVDGAIAVKSLDTERPWYMVDGQERRDAGGEATRTKPIDGERDGA